MTSILQSGYQRKSGRLGQQRVAPSEHHWRYDSSELWAPPDNCTWPAAAPAHPTAAFDAAIATVCAQVPKACPLFKRTLPDTWDKCLQWQNRDGTAYVITGDIPLMWLRDTVAQVTPYMPLVTDSSVQQFMEGVLRRSMVWIKLDPYGSSFRMKLDYRNDGRTQLKPRDITHGRTVHVAQHDYEPDSLAYVVRLAYLYWNATGRTCWMGRELPDTFNRIIQLWVTEQDHEAKSKYRYPTLARDGRGTKVCRTGMTWGGMRPSDDSMKYHFNIPGNMFSSVALGYILDMASKLWPQAAWVKTAAKLKAEIDHGIATHGVVDGRYAYEVDGCGNVLFADDANIPSLLAAPYLGYPVDPAVYAATRSAILSKKGNPWYWSGSVLSGIGSPHGQCLVSPPFSST